MESYSQDVNTHVKRGKLAIFAITCFLAFLSVIIVVSTNLLTKSNSCFASNPKAAEQSSTANLLPGQSVRLECSGSRIISALSNGDKTLLVQCLANTITPTTSFPQTTNAPIPTNSGGHSCMVETPAQPNSQNKMVALSGLDCSGYSEPRVWMESQSWWYESKTDGSNGAKCFPGDHIHLNTCMPFLQKIRGVVPFKINSTLHSANNSAEGPGTANLLRIQLWDKADPIYSQKLDWTCPAGQNCSQTFDVNVDTTKAKTDGEGEFRMTINIPCNKSSTKPSCDRFYNTTRWFSIIDNGKNVSNYNHYDGAGGWYNGTGYSNIKIERSDLLKLSYQTLSGIVPIRVAGDKKELVVAVDSANHGMKPGWELYNGSGGGGWKTVTLDTNNLANGYHKFSVRTCDETSKGTGCGVFVVAFKVQN